MSPLPPDDLNRIADYVAKELSPGDIEATRQWIAEDEERKKLVDYLCPSGEHASHGQRAYVDVDVALAVISARIGGTTNPYVTAAADYLDQTNSTNARRKTRRTMVGGTPRWWNRRVMGSAAALVAFGIIAFATFNTWRPSRSRTRPAQMYSTRAGQQAKVTLAEGSQVLLGPATTLSVTTDPSDAGLDVRLTGQALFTVRHGTTNPFRVHAGHAVTQVLGTTFLVRRYETDRAARVVVAEGRVSLDGMRGAVATASRHVLTKNMLGTVDDSGRVEIIPNVAVEDYTAWTTGELVFRGTPLRDAVIELSRAYDVDLRVTDSVLAAHRLDWTIPVAQRSLMDVLESLGEALRAHVVRAGRVITLVPGQSPIRRPIDIRTLSPSEHSYGK